MDTEAEQNLQAATVEQWHYCAYLEEKKKEPESYWETDDFSLFCLFLYCRCSQVSRVRGDNKQTKVFSSAPEWILYTIVLLAMHARAAHAGPHLNLLSLKTEMAKSPHVLSSSRRTDTCVNISLVKLEILIQLIYSWKRNKLQALKCSHSVKVKCAFNVKFLELSFHSYLSYNMCCILHVTT